MPIERSQKAVGFAEVHEIVKDLGANKLLTKQAFLKQIIDAIRELGEERWRLPS